MTCFQHDILSQGQGHELDIACPLVMVHRPTRHSMSELCAMHSLTPICSSKPPGKSTSLRASIASSIVIVLFLMRSLLHRLPLSVSHAVDQTACMRACNALPILRQQTACARLLGHHTIFPGRPSEHSRMSPAVHSSIFCFCCPSSAHVAGQQALLCTSEQAQVLYTFSTLAF